jgi:hypothetical protein
VSPRAEQPRQAPLEEPEERLQAALGTQFTQEEMEVTLAEAEEQPVHQELERKAGRFCREQTEGPEAEDQTEELPEEMSPPSG